MKKPKSIADILASNDSQQEVYLSDQLHRNRRATKGIYAKSHNLFDFIHLAKQWDQMVGKLMAENTIPLKIKNGTLLVLTKHSVFAQELSFMTEEIIQKINKSFPNMQGVIKKIKFLHGKYSSHDFEKELKSPVQDPPKKINRFNPHVQKQTVKAQKMFEDIEDQEIRELLISIYLLNTV